MMQIKLDDDEPAVFDVYQRDAYDLPLLLCDHAGNHIPRMAKRLGLGDDGLQQHIAYDIGAGELTRLLAQTLGWPAIWANYSRLWVDLNRKIDDPTLIRELSDHQIITGNVHLSHDQMEARIQQLYHPYHQAIADFITKSMKIYHQDGPPPMAILVHSFTPNIRMKGQSQSRKWHIGLLSDGERRLTNFALDYFARHHRELNIGDNQPYSGNDAYDKTVSSHLKPKGIARLLIEIRQDLINTSQGVARMANILTPLLQEMLAQCHDYPPLCQESNR